MCSSTQEPSIAKGQYLAPGDRIKTRKMMSRTTRGWFLFSQYSDKTFISLKILMSLLYDDHLIYLYTTKDCVYK